MKTVRLLALVGVVALVGGSCAYYRGAVEARNAGGPVPWWCTSTEEIPVTEGPASGNVDWYEDVDKAPLSYAQCETMSAQFDQARAYALRWPTRGAAEADGWREVTGFVPGMGTHHVRGGITPAMLNSSSFNPENPILDAVGLDAVFDPARPDVLQFDGNGPEARLVGFDYYVRTNTGLPPAGFPGTNDWWHHHPEICHRTSDARMIAFNVSDADCASREGINVNFSNYYMLHVWVLADMTYRPDVFAGMIPCIPAPGAGTIHDDPDHPCHFGRGGGGTAAAEHDMAAAGHDMGG